MGILPDIPPVEPTQQGQVGRRISLVPAGHSPRDVSSDVRASGHHKRTMAIMNPPSVASGSVRTRGRYFSARQFHQVRRPFRPCRSRARGRGSTRLASAPSIPSRAATMHVGGASADDAGLDFILSGATVMLHAIREEHRRGTMRRSPQWVVAPPRQAWHVMNGEEMHKEHPVDGPTRTSARERNTLSHPSADEAPAAWTYSHAVPPVSRVRAMPPPGPALSKWRLDLLLGEHPDLHEEVEEAVSAARAGEGASSGGPTDEQLLGVLLERRPRLRDTLARLEQGTMSTTTLTFPARAMWTAAGGRGTRAPTYSELTQCQPALSSPHYLLSSGSLRRPPSSHRRSQVPHLDRRVAAPGKRASSVGVYCNMLHGGGVVAVPRSTGATVGGVGGSGIDHGVSRQHHSPSPRHTVSHSFADADAVSADDPSARAPMAGGARAVVAGGTAVEVPTLLETVACGGEAVGARASQQRQEGMLSDARPAHPTLHSSLSITHLDGRNLPRSASVSGPSTAPPSPSSHAPPASSPPALSLGLPAAPSPGPAAPSQSPSAAVPPPHSPADTAAAAAPAALAARSKPTEPVHPSDVNDAIALTVSGARARPSTREGRKVVMVSKAPKDPVPKREPFARRLRQSLLAARRAAAGGRGAEPAGAFSENRPEADPAKRVRVLREAREQRVRPWRRRTDRDKEGLSRKRRKRKRNKSKAEKEEGSGGVAEEERAMTVQSTHSSRKSTRSTRSARSSRASEREDGVAPEAAETGGESHDPEGTDLYYSSYYSLSDEESPLVPVRGASPARWTTERSFDGLNRTTIFSMDFMMAFSSHKDLDILKTPLGATERLVSPPTPGRSSSPVQPADLSYQVLAVYDDATNRYVQSAGAGSVVGVVLDSSPAFSAEQVAHESGLVAIFEAAEMFCCTPGETCRMHVMSAHVFTGYTLHVGRVIDGSLNRLAVLSPDGTWATESDGAQEGGSTVVVDMVSNGLLDVLNAIRAEDRNETDPEVRAAALEKFKEQEEMRKTIAEKIQNVLNAATTFVSEVDHNVDKDDTKTAAVTELSIAGEAAGAVEPEAPAPSAYSYYSEVEEEEDEDEDVANVGGVDGARPRSSDAPESAAEGEVEGHGGSDGEDDNPQQPRPRRQRASSKASRGKKGRPAPVRVKSTAGVKHSEESTSKGTSVPSVIRRFQAAASKVVEGGDRSNPAVRESGSGSKFSTFRAVVDSVTTKINSEIVQEHLQQLAETYGEDSSDNGVYDDDDVDARSDSSDHRMRRYTSSLSGKRKNAAESHHAWLKTLENRSTAIELETHPEDLLRRGAMYCMLGMLPEAEDDLQRALECAEDNLNTSSEIAALWHLSLVFTRASETDVALQCLERILVLDDTHTPAHRAQGDLYAALKQYDKARRCYEAGILAAKDPKVLADLLYLRGEILEDRLGNTADAAGDYAKVIKLDPTNADAWFRAGRWHMSCGRYEDALPHLSKAAALQDPPATETLLLKARVETHLHHWASAFDCFARVLEVDPRNAMALLCRGMAYRARDPDAALRDLSASIAIEPSIAAYLNRSIVYHSFGSVGMRCAIADANSAIELFNDPSHKGQSIPRPPASIGPVLLTNHGCFLVELGNHNASADGNFVDALELDETYVRAALCRSDLMASMANYEEAAALLAWTIVLGTSHKSRGLPLRYLYRGKLQLEAGFMGEAKDDLSAALRLGLGRGVLDGDEDWVSTLQSSDKDELLEHHMADQTRSLASLAGLQNMEQGKLEEALLDFKKAVLFTPKDPMCIVDRGVCYQKLGDHPAAILDLQHALEVTADKRWKLVRVETLVRLAFSLLYSGSEDLKAMADLLEEAIGLMPQCWHAHALKARLCEKMNDIHHAILSTSRALHNRPKSSVDLSNSGTYKFMIGNWEAGMTDYAAAQQQGYAPALFNMGAVLHARGLLVEALAHYSSCLKVAPDHLPALINRALIFLKSKKHTTIELAARDLARAVALSPEDTDLRVCLGMAHFHLGRLGLAWRSYDDACQRHPRHRAALHGRVMTELGLCAVRKKTLPSASTQCQRALRLYPTDPQLNLCFAQVLTAMGRYDQAWWRFSHVISLASQYTSQAAVDTVRLAHEGRARVATLTNNFFNAEQDITTALGKRRVPRAPRASKAVTLGLLVNRGILQQQQNDIGGARASFESAVAMDPTCTTAHFNLGNLALGREQWEEAVARFSDVLALEATDARALMNRATCFHKMGRSDEAFDDLSAALRSESTALDNLESTVELRPVLRRGDSLVPAILFNRAAVHADIGTPAHLALADQDYAQSIEVATLLRGPRPPSLHEAETMAKRANVLAKQDRGEESMQLVQQALSIDCNINLLESRTVAERGAYWDAAASTRVVDTLRSLLRRTNSKRVNFKTDLQLALSLATGQLDVDSTEVLHFGQPIDRDDNDAVFRRTWIVCKIKQGLHVALRDARRTQKPLSLRNVFACIGQAIGAQYQWH